MESAGTTLRGRPNPAQWSPIQRWYRYGQPEQPLLRQKLLDRQRQRCRRARQRRDRLAALAVAIPVTTRRHPGTPLLPDCCSSLFSPRCVVTVRRRALTVAVGTIITVTRGAGVTEQTRTDADADAGWSFRTHRTRVCCVDHSTAAVLGTTQFCCTVAARGGVPQVDSTKSRRRR